MNKGERIKAAREAANLTQEELGRLCGTTKQTIYKYENGIVTNIPLDRIEKMASVTGVSSAYITGWKDDSNTHAKGVRIPVYGAVAAGIPIEAIEDIVDYEEIDAAMAATGKYFGLRIKGHSMEPRICEDDVVIVRKQKNVETEEIAIVMVNREDATCKRIKKEANGLSLIPINPLYDIKFYSAEEVNSLPVRIIGKVVELRGKF